VIELEDVSGLYPAVVMPPRGLESKSPRRSWRDIARKYSISDDTVKHHLSNIYNKVGSPNRLELALFAVHHHLIDNINPSA